MRYVLLDLDIEAPIPDLALDDDDYGIAVLLRRRGRPVDFWMQSLPPRTQLAPEVLARQIGERAGAALVEASLRDELAVRPTGRLPSLTVAICTKDRAPLLARCLGAVESLPPRVIGRPFAPSILVVDNAPSDAATRELVARHPQIRYICEPRPGLDFARNCALRAAESELLAFVDDDALVDAGWLEGLMEAWMENPDAAAFTGLVLPSELETEAQVLFEQRGGFRRGFRKLRFHGPHLHRTPLYPCGAGIFGAGANMAFRRDILLAIGGFDEALDTGPPLPGGGDLDIFYRVIRAGYPLVYEPRYLVFHQHRRTMEGLRHQYESWGRGHMAFVVKTYRTDEPQRRKLLKLIWWWFRHQFRELKASWWGKEPFPSRMVLAELFGGIKGLLGEYDRSLARTEHIRRRSPRAPSAIATFPTAES